METSTTFLYNGVHLEVLSRPAPLSVEARSALCTVQVFPSMVQFYRVPTPVDVGSAREESDAFK